ncbi:hypothetical protein ACW9KT_12290 [Hymenobacter sp. HD11105]
MPAAVTDPEFDILDELYFVTSFRDLLQKTGLTTPVLEKGLRSLLEQEYVKSFYPDPDTEQAYEVTSFGAICRDSFYLATKAGLLAHNTR